MLGLAIDSAQQSASAALWCSARGSLDAGQAAIIDSGVLSPDEGRADQLIEVIERLLARQGLGYGDLALLAVNRGPGSFTGIRSAVALARGLALAARLPVLGVTSHEVLASGLERDAEGRRTLIAEDARRGEVYVQAFGADGVAETPILARALDAAAADLGRGAWRLAGSGARLVAAAVPIDADVRLVDIEPADAEAVARAAARRLGRGEAPAEGFRLRPLYVRAPDATPPTPLIEPVERTEVPA